MDNMDKLVMTVNGHRVCVFPSHRGFGLSVDRTFWGYFVDEMVAMNAAIVVINAPHFGERCAS